MKLLILFFATAFQLSSNVGARPIASYWDALQTTRSVGEAHAIPQPANTSAGRDADIAAAMLQFREYELTYDRTDALVAIKQLERVIARTPKDAWAHFALGVALARGPDVRQRPYAERNVYVVFSKGTLAAIHAPQELKRALELDPGLGVAAQELGQLAIDYADRDMIRDALTYLTAEGVAQTANALMLQSKLQQRLGASAASHKLAEKAEDAGADPSIAAYHRAETMFRSAGGAPRPLTPGAPSVASRPNTAVIEGGASEYLEGLFVLTPAGADLYYSSIELLLTPNEAEEWRNATVAQRGRWLRNFWDVRAALAGVTVPTRLAEHFRRVAQLDPYRAPKTSASPTAQNLEAGRKPSIEVLTPEVIGIIRHGDASRITKFANCAPGWDTLPIPDQPSLRECLQSPYAASRFMRHGDCPPLPPDPDMGAKLARMYCMAAGGVVDEMDAVAMRGNRYAAAKHAVRGETFYPAYSRKVGIAWEAIQFHGPGIGAEVIVAIAIPQQSFGALDDGQGALSAVVGLTLADTINNSVTRAQKSLSVPMQQLASSSFALVYATAAAQAAPDVALRIRVESPDGSAGAIAYGDIDVEAFNEDSLTISDIVLSPTDGIGSFKRGDISLTLAPGRAFAHTESPTIYYEVYGSKADSRLTTEISVDPIRGGVGGLMDRVTGDAHALSVRFDEPASAPLPQFGVQLSRSLALASLQPGDYRLTVTVRDSVGGRTATRGRLLTVR